VNARKANHQRRALEDHLHVKPWMGPSRLRAHNAHLERLSSKRLRREPNWVQPRNVRVVLEQVRPATGRPLIPSPWRPVQSASQAGPETSEITNSGQTFRQHGETQHPCSHAGLEHNYLSTPRASARLACHARRSRVRVPVASRLRQASLDDARLIVCPGRWRTPAKPATRRTTFPCFPRAAQRSNASRKCSSGNTESTSGRISAMRRAARRSAPPRRTRRPGASARDRDDAAGPEVGAPRERLPTSCVEEQVAGLALLRRARRPARGRADRDVPDAAPRAGDEDALASARAFPWTTVPCHALSAGIGSARRLLVAQSHRLGASSVSGNHRHTSAADCASRYEEAISSATHPREIRPSTRLQPNPAASS
jgi:hypothetical protein